MEWNEIVISLICCSIKLYLAPHLRWNQKRGILGWDIVASNINSNNGLGLKCGHASHIFGPGWRDDLLVKWRSAKFLLRSFSEPN